MSNTLPTLVTTSQQQAALLGRLAIAALAVLSLWLNGCEDPPDGPVPDKARLRVVHLAYDAPSIDLRVDAGVFRTGIAFGASSGYTVIEPGSRRLGIADVASTVNRVETSASLEAGMDYTVFVFPPAAFVTAQLRRDDRTVVPASQARIRWVNATSDGANLELRIADQPWMPQLAAGQSSDQLLKSTDVVSLVVFNRVTNRAVAAYNPTTFENKTYTVVVHGTISTSDRVALGVRVFEDGGDGTASFDLTEAPTTSQLMAFNTLAGASPVNVTVDGSPFSTGLAPNAATSYTTVPQGALSVRFTTGGTVLSTSTLNTTAGKRYSVFVSGTLSPQDVVALPFEDATTPNPAQALVRLVHLSPDVGRLDLIVPVPGLGDYRPTGMQGIAFRQASVSASSGSNFLAFPPTTGTPYMFSFVQAGGTKEMLAAPDVTLQAGKIYTLWVGGRLVDNSLRLHTVQHN
jgi:hypothetical protein